MSEAWRGGSDAETNRESQDNLIPDMHWDRARDWLKQGVLRPTKQRLTLAMLLVGDGNDRHVTAEGLYALADRSGMHVSLATVYNTLRAFSDAGLLREVTVDGSRSYFDTKTDDHPHFYWEDDGSLSDAPASQLKISMLPDIPEGAEISTVDVLIRLRKKPSGAESA